MNKKAKIKIWIQASMIAVFSLFLATNFTQNYDVPKDTEQSIENTVTDIDGNVYATVIIGNQVWMAENLKTTKYNDGTDIPNITDAHEWGHPSLDAYCWYDNDSNNGNIYGALYKWQAVNIGKLCPVGWHVPTDEEWIELENYLADNGYNYDGSTGGGCVKIAKALSNDSGWRNSTSEGAVGNADFPEYRNKSGFAALPAGTRYSNGNFNNIGNYSFWWSATEYCTYNAWLKGVGSDFSDVESFHYNKHNGFSVRCVRD